MRVLLVKLASDMGSPAARCNSVQSYIVSITLGLAYYIPIEIVSALPAGIRD